MYIFIFPSLPLPPPPFPSDPLNQSDFFFFKGERFFLFGVGGGGGSICVSIYGGFKGHLECELVHKF